MNATNSPSEPRSVSVLFVTPDESVREQAATALEAAQTNLEIQTARDASEALINLERDSIDCIVWSEAIISDESLGFLETVRCDGQTLPVILFTEEFAPEPFRTALRGGMTDFVPRKGESDRWSLLVDRIVGVVERARTRERAVELERITSVIRELNRTLVHATTREAIDERVCEIFSESEPYVFSWIGHRKPDSDQVTARASCGIEAGYLEEVVITAGEEATGQGPTGRAIRTGEIQVMQNIPEDPQYEPWREAALERGYKSSAAIPLVFEDTLYGVLNVYADRIHAFDEEERQLLKEVGDDIAYAYRDLAIREERRQFEKAIEQAADAIFITDTDGTIEYVNPAFEDLTEFGGDDAIGRNPRILKSGEHGDEYYEEMWETILSGDIWSSEIINERNSGDRYYAEQTIAPITDATGAIEAFVAIQRDITERKEREQELSQQKERFEAVVENVHDGLVIVQDGVIQYINPRTTELTGYAPAEVLGDPPTTLVAKEDQDRVMERYRERIAGESIEETYEIDILARNGDRIPVELSVGVMEYGGEPATITAIRDISERQALLTDLQERTTHLNHAQAIANVGSWHLDMETDTLEWSDEVHRIFEVDTDEGMSYEKFLDCVHPADRDYVDEEWAAALDGEPYDIEHRIQVNDHVKWVRERADIEFEDDTPTEGIGVVQDITDRKERERELERQRGRLRALFEEAPDGIILHDSGGGVIDANETIINELGYTREELLSMVISDIEIGIDVASLQEEWDSLAVGAMHRMEVQGIHRRKDGSTFPVEVWVSKIRSPETDRDRFLALSRDITERKAPEQELERYEEIVESASDVLWMFRADFSELLFVNSPYEDLFGQPETTLREDPLAFIEAVHPDDRGLLRRKIDQLSGGEPVDFELRVNPKEDFDRWVWIKGDPVYDDDGNQFAVSGFVRDITDRKQQQQQLRRIRRAVESSGHAIYITDPDGNIEYANPAFEDITGYSVDEAIGANPRILKSGEMSDEYYDELWATLQTEEVWKETVINQRKNGELYHAHQTIAPVTDDTGEIESYVAIQTDITERKRLEDHLQESIRQLQVIDRVLRHNLHNDMNLIEGYAETIRDATTGDIADYATDIVEESEDLLNTVDKERVITKLLANPKPTRSINVVTIVEDIIENVREEFPSAEITLDAPDEATVATTERMGQAIDELIQNAIIHTDREQPRVKVSIAKTSEGTVLRVADTGPGIPEMEREVLTGEAEIEPLYHGSGLGLWMVHLIVEESGGTLSFAENDPRGSIVTVEFPASPSAVASDRALAGAGTVPTQDLDRGIQDNDD